MQAYHLLHVLHLLVHREFHLPKNTGDHPLADKIMIMERPSQARVETLRGRLWDIVDSIDDTVTYPYCDKLLHWLKGVGYKRYSQRAKRAFYVKMLLRIHRYPHYVKAIFLKLMGKRR